MFEMDGDMDKKKKKKIKKKEKLEGMKKEMDIVSKKYPVIWERREKEVTRHIETVLFYLDLTGIHRG